MQLHHEKLDAYQVSTEFLGFAFKIIKNMPPGYGFLGDQLKRASLSIPLNIAEGNGKFNPQDQSKFYKIARGSANECGAILAAASTINVIEHEQWQKGKNLIVRIVSMLSKMI